MDFSALMDSQCNCETSRLGSGSRQSTFKLLRRAATDPKHISKYFITVPVEPIQELMCCLY